MTRITIIEGTALPMRGDDIDTDRIMPARHLRSVTFEGLEQYVFGDERAGGPSAGSMTGLHPFDNSTYAGASVLLVNRNFGCGSSREHAPQGLQRWGIKAIVGESFSEIFFGNSVMIGMPCVTASRNDVGELMARVENEPQLPVRVDLTSGTCTAGDFTCPVSIPAKFRDAFATGAWDTTGLLLERYEEVDAVANRLPYVRGF
jgi:3-isopropylmalate/(R)-2-methylmalate dehydratase small subunit